MGNQIMDFCRKNWLPIFLAAIIGFLLYNHFGLREKPEENNEEPLPWKEETTKDVASPEPSETKKQEEAVEPILKVDIKGAVNRPGVYEFLKGERVLDVIQKAGGLSKEAENTDINLAQLLKDEMVIYIPKKGEKDHPVYSSSSVSNEVPGNVEQASSEKVNINSATAEELQTLPGIGPSKAAAILEKREELGVFKAVEDLKQVTGIGEKTFEKLKDNISLD